MVSILTLFILIERMPSPIQIPEEPMLVISDANGGETRPMKQPIAAALSEDGYLYILDYGLSLIYKLSMEGELIKTIGGEGQGPGEFFRPTDLTFFGKQLWVADGQNGRLQIFEQDQFVRSLVLRGIQSPGSLAVLGDEIFVSGGSLTPHHGPITVLSRDGDKIRSLSWFPGDHTDKGRTIGLWTRIRMRPMKDNLLLGFTFDNLLAVLDGNGAVMTKRHMDGIYEAYSEQHGSDTIPAGFAAMAFGAGPEQTVLVATCDQESRSCGTLIRLQPDLSKVIQRWDFGPSIRYVSCLTDYRMLILINLDAEVRIYAYQ